MLFYVAIIIIVVLLYKWFLNNPLKGYWKKYGVPEIDISAAVTTFDIFLGRRAIFAGDDFAYKQMGNSMKYCGVVSMGKPEIIVKDIDLVKKVLIKDFDYFVDRRQFFSNEGSLDKMLPTLQGDEWKGVRVSVSPTFTTGKIRGMMEYFNEVGQEWVEMLIKKANSNSRGTVDINVVQTVNQYTVDVIASTVFGMHAGTVKNPKSLFSTMATRLSDINAKQLFKFTIKLQFPSLYKKLGLKMFDVEALDFFDNIFTQGLQARMSGETKRNDFLQLLTEAKKGKLKAAGSDELSSFERDAQIAGTERKQEYLTDEVLNAQSVIFFIAGYSTTSNFITFVLYALAVHQDVQTKLREEVNKAAKENGSFDYDDLAQLVYMDMVLCEIFRKYPVAARLERVCVKEYKDFDSGLVVPKGTNVIIPLNAIHHDKNFYDNPDKFDPEGHFSPEKKAARNPYAFMPFGMGPRNCIGMRFALQESKAAIAHIVHNFSINPTEKTPIPIQAKPVGLQYMPPKDLELRLTAILK